MLFDLFFFFSFSGVRVVVQGQGPGPRYGHVMDLVAQRYLVTVSGNDGESDQTFCFQLNALLVVMSLEYKGKHDGEI